MKLVALYRDPKKRWLQRVEIGVLALLLPLALVWGSQTTQLWLAFRQAEKIYTQAEVLLHEDKPAQAIPLLEKSVAIYSEFLPAWQALGASYHLAGDHQGEVESFQRAVKIFPEEHLLYRDLATAYHERGDHEAELQYLELASKLPMEDEIFMASLLMRARAEAAGESPKGKVKG